MTDRPLVIKPQYAQLALVINRLMMIRPRARVHNQYHEDTPGSAYRRGNLAFYLTQMYDHQPRVMVVGEAPSFTGTRQSGIPFTSEAIMLQGLKNWDLFGPRLRYRQASDVPGGYTDPIATMTWSILEESHHLPLMWYCYPCHAHKEGDERSYRTPNEREREIGIGFIMELDDIFKFDRIVPIGEKTARTLWKHEVNCTDPIPSIARVGRDEFKRQLMAHLDRYPANRGTLARRDIELKML